MHTGLILLHNLRHLPNFSPDFRYFGKLCLEGEKKAEEESECISLHPPPVTGSIERCLMWSPLATLQPKGREICKHRRCSHRPFKRSV
ncbi:hypothetical protein RRG08_046818 [Elysia crispata]|uniref:Uncharacterized protein n=1 Tax=Elysia crispata TaxID=231223 RepID=A0AAE1DIZ4_9GAST|nr:hypothetical protein RRG08_046818 [Elysia crispata]